MAKVMIHTVHEDPIKWALAILTGFVGLEIDVVPLAAFTWIVIGHSVIGAIKSVRVDGWSHLSFDKFLAGILKYISVLLLMLIMAIGAHYLSMPGYKVFSETIVWFFSGILIYYSFVNVVSSWTGKDHKKEDLIEWAYKNFAQFLADVPKRIFRSLKSKYDENSDKA